MVHFLKDLQTFSDISESNLKITFNWLFQFVPIKLISTEFLFRYSKEIKLGE